MSDGRLVFRPGARGSTRISASSLVTGRPFGAEGDFLHVYEATSPDLRLSAWLAANRPRMKQRLLDCAALLFRGFSVPSPAEFGEAARALYGDLLGYLERAAIRREMAPNVFTSTELAPDQTIPLHHEMSYSHNWPSQIFFFCSRRARTGGETPIADERRITGRIPLRIRERFLAHGVMYVRNYRPELEPWQDAFQTGERAVVEEYCRSARIHHQWLDGDCLRTRQVRQAMATHPTTGQSLWFNHAHLFHSSNLPPDVRRGLVATYGEDGLPRNAFFGDGSLMDEGMLDEIRSIYDGGTVTFPWQRGDVLLLDNFLATHGRRPYSGDRETLVTMCNLHTNTRCLDLARNVP